VCIPQVKVTEHSIYLLPEPRSLDFRNGAFNLSPTVNISLVANAAYHPITRHAVRLLQRWLDTLGYGAILFNRDQLPPNSSAHGLIVLSCGQSTTDESYDLTVSRKIVTARSPGPKGLHYAINTLIQLVHQFHPQIPCLNIQDRPAFQHRGYLLDISRGRVPTVTALERLIDRLAFFKINELQLYVEHTFRFAFDPAISSGCDHITASDIRHIDSYCQQHGIEMVPCLATFGHMARILSMSSYRNLAAIPPRAHWENLSWDERAHGSTINPLHPGTSVLLKKMMDEYLPLFTSRYFNGCADEPYDLGRGTTRQAAGRLGLPRLFADHIKFLRKCAADHQKRLMIWSDFPLHHPATIPLLPSDTIVLDWGYSASMDFMKTRVFSESGLPTRVCPSTRGYRVLFNRVEEARLNISRYARSGCACRSEGLLNTDWGDLGHFNLPAASLHGMLLGAAMAWNPSADAESHFDQAFSRILFDDPGDHAAYFYRTAGSIEPADWALLISPEIDPPSVTRQFPKHKLVASRDMLSELIRIHNHFHENILLDNTDIDELRLALEAIDLLHRRLMLAGRHDYHSHSAKLAADVLNFSQKYKTVWLRTSKPLGLERIVRKLSKLARTLSDN